MRRPPRSESAVIRGASSSFSRAVERGFDRVALVRGEPLQMLGEPGGAAALDGRASTVSPSGVSVSPIRRRSAARVRSISPAVSSRDDVPGHPGRRHALALARARGRRCPGSALIWISSDT